MVCTQPHSVLCVVVLQGRQPSTAVCSNQAAPAPSHICSAERSVVWAQPSRRCFGLFMLISVVKLMLSLLTQVFLLIHQLWGSLLHRVTPHAKGLHSVTPGATPGRLVVVVVSSQLLHRTCLVVNPFPLSCPMLPAAAAADCM